MHALKNQPYQGNIQETILGDIMIPVVPHKAVAEVSKIGNYRGGELL